MRVLYGMYPSDGGRILVRGEEVKVGSPRDAIALGIGMVHQHFVLVDPFTVTENIILGEEGGERLDMDAAQQRVSDLAETYAFRVDPRAVVEDLSVGEEQRVEILKALYRGVEILILDEPTAVLTPNETKDLFGNLRKLREAGRTIVFISHKLDEVMEIADRITVLRRGTSGRRDTTRRDHQGQAGRDDGGPSRAVPAREADGRRSGSRCCGSRTSPATGS